MLCKREDWSLDFSTRVTSKTWSHRVATPALSGVEMGIVGVCWASGLLGKKHVPTHTPPGKLQVL